MSKKTKKPFIVFEGIDGSGTTTISKKLVEHLNKGGIAAEWTAEPTTGEIGKLIRRALHGEFDFSTDAETMTLLFAADRASHVNTFINPAVNSGKVVVCDRYSFSTFVYQSIQAALVGSKAERFRNWLDSVSTRFPVPDVIIVLDSDTETAAERISCRDGKPEILEKESILQEARTKYLDETVRFANKHKESEIFIVNTDTMSIEQVFQCVCDILGQSKIAKQLGM